METGRICMFTGHRNIEYRHAKTLPQQLDELLERLIEEGYTEFRAGGAVGFDTFAALKVLEKRKKYGFVKLHLFLPCQDQEKKWKENMKASYYFVKEQADTVRYISEEYHSGCMQQRNRAMVDGSELCVAYCGRSSGGSAYALGYAKQKGLEVINIYK